MPAQESRGSLWALRERYLWLWRQLQKLDQRLRVTKPEPLDQTRLDFFTERMKQQLKRYWP